MPAEADKMYLKLLENGHKQDFMSVSIRKELWPPKGEAKPSLTKPYRTEGLCGPYIWETSYALRPRAWGNGHDHISESNSRVGKTDDRQRGEATF